MVRSLKNYSHREKGAAVGSPGGRWRGVGGCRLGPGRGPAAAPRRRSGAGPGPGRMAGRPPGAGDDHPRGGAGRDRAGAAGPTRGGWAWTWGGGSGRGRSGGSDPGIGTLSGGQPWGSWQVKRLDCTGVQCRACPSWTLDRGNGPRPKPRPIPRAGAEQGNLGGSQVLGSRPPPGYARGYPVFARDWPGAVPGTLTP